MPTEYPLSRRAMLQVSAWSVPAIVAATSAPAYAASGDQLAFTAVPQNTTNCRATTEPVTVQLSGAAVGGQLVQFTLSSGWTWARGSGSYVSDGAGVATVPAGDIVAGVSSGTIDASWSSSTAAAAIPVTATGVLTSESRSSLTGLTGSDNADIIRVVTNADGAVAVTGGGKIWSRDAGHTEWASMGTGAAIGVGQATYMLLGSRQGALWISGGQLYFRESPFRTDDVVENTGFVRVCSMGGIAVAVRDNGEVFQCDSDNGFTALGTNGFTGPDQLAVAVSADPDVLSRAVWIKAGVIQFGSEPASLPDGENTGFLRVYSTAGGVTAITAGGSVWAWTSAGGWTSIGSGATTMPGQATYLADGDNNAPMWVSGGVLYYGDAPGSFDKDDVVGVTAPTDGRFVLAATGAGELWVFDKGAEYLWTRVTASAALGPGQFAHAGEVGGAKVSFWITPRTSC